MMKFNIMQYMITASLFFVVLLGTGCQEENLDLPVEMELQLLDEKGNPSTVFHEGKNFHFNFVIKNKTAMDIGYSPTFMDDDFFNVYKIDPSDGEVSIGKPYANVFCEFSGSSFIIPSGDDRVFEIPWSPSEDFCCPPFCKVIKNSPLPKGKYKTSIEGPFTFTYLEKTITITNKYKINFEIE